MNELLIELSSLLRSGGALVPLAAFVGGFLTSLTPCSLSSLPFVIAYIGGGEEKSRSKNLTLSATYAAGNAISFALLGLAAALLGRIINLTGSWWYILIGLLMVVVALNQFGLVDITKKFTKFGQKVKRNRFGALVFGIISGIFASPCATPILTALIFMIATSQLSILKGVGLFLLFAAGNAITIITVGMLSGRVGIIKNEGYSKFAKAIQYGFGLIILVFGVFLISQGL